MTAHELARKLLDGPDEHVRIHIPPADCYIPEYVRSDNTVAVTQVTSVNYTLTADTTKDYVLIVGERAEEKRRLTPLLRKLNAQ